MPLLYEEDYALFIVLLSLIFIGWLGQVIVVSGMIAGLNLHLFHFNPSVASMAPNIFFLVWCGVDWDKGKLLSILPSSVVEQIVLVHISSTRPDILRWAIFRDGNFSLRSSWEFVRRSRSQNEVFSLIW